MWTCHRCGKPVYFAERRQSVGFDWHPLCLKCEECGKILQPGQHAQHKSSPYCHVPCYAALFGPSLFGHGSTTESHRSFGNRSKSFIRLETELSNKVKEYNRYYSEYPRCQLTAREVNGRLVLEGVLKVYWGTQQSIRLKQYEDNRVINRNKKALSLGFQYASVEYDSDGQSGGGGSLAGSKDDPSLLFPPQFGDLSIHFPPGLDDSTQHGGELQKWETLTTLDKESKPSRNLQLLESLIENKSLKLTTRNITLQRSQSVKASSTESKKTSQKGKNKRFSCNITDLHKDILSDANHEELLAIGEDRTPDTSRDEDDMIESDDDGDEAMDVSKRSEVFDSSDNECGIVDDSESNTEFDDVFVQSSDAKVEPDDLVVNETLDDENMNDLLPEALDVEDRFGGNSKSATDTNTAEHTNTATNCDTNTDQLNHDLQDANSNLRCDNDALNPISKHDEVDDKENLVVKEHESTDEVHDSTDEVHESTDESHDNGEEVHERTDKVHDKTDEQADSDEDLSFISADESFNLEESDAEKVATEKEIAKRSPKHVIATTEILVEKENDKSSKIESNGNEISNETYDEKETNIDKSSKEDPKENRRPSVEFNVYKSRNPPKIKRSPEKLILSNYTSVAGLEPTKDCKGDQSNQRMIENLSDQKVQLRHPRGNKNNKPANKNKSLSLVMDGDKPASGGGGPRALRRRKGGRMTRIRRRSSINGHWYDRETAVFTPPKDAAMSVWSTSLQSCSEVLTSLLTKYKIESEATDFGLFVVKETGERRLISDAEFPLLLRTHLGPHEDIAKLYVMNKQTTGEISDKVAEFLMFSWAELRAFLNMFYEEEEREADNIRYKYHKMREIMQQRLEELTQQNKIMQNNEHTDGEEQKEETNC